MKFKLFSNDRSTVKDELLLLGFILLCLSVGSVLLILRPSFWCLDQFVSLGLGMLLTLTGILFIPGLIYRLMTNDRKT